MIKQYFDNLMNTLLNEKVELEKKITGIENRRKEIERFIEILKEKNDTSFESFTPREVNSKNKEKIRELEQENKTLQKNSVEIKQKLANNEKSRDELSSIMQYMNRQEIEKDVIEKQREDVSREKMSDLENDYIEIEETLKKVNASMQFLDVDIMRAKLELRQLIPELEEQIKKIKGLF